MRRLWSLAICLAALSASAQSRDTGGAGVSCVTLMMVQRMHLSDAEIETIRDQMTRIWRQQDVHIVFTSGEAAPDEGHLRLVLTDAPLIGPATSNLCALGVIRFIGGRPDPELTVNVAAAREFVRRARPEVLPAVQTLMAARIVGRAAAHELGHYLFEDRGHRPSGLMRARFDGVDLLGGRLDAFAPPSSSEITRAVSARLSCGQSIRPVHSDRSRLPPHRLSRRPRVR